MSQNNSFKKDSPEVANFLSKPSNVDRLHSFKEALERPDGPPVTEPLQLRPPQKREPEHVEGKGSELALSNATGMALEVPGREPGRNGRPLHGKKPKVEKTFAIDDEIHSRLIEISNWEGIRHKKKFSVSFVMSHLLEFALAHVEGTKVIPIDGAEGLVIPNKGA